MFILNSYYSTCWSSIVHLNSERGRIIVNKFYKLILTFRFFDNVSFFFLILNWLQIFIKIDCIFVSSFIIFKLLHRFTCLHTFCLYWLVFYNLWLKLKKLLIGIQFNIIIIRQAQVFTVHSLLLNRSNRTTIIHFTSLGNSWWSRLFQIRFVTFV